MIVDSGNQSVTPDKIGLIADVLSQLKYDAVGMGNADLQMGEPFLNAMGGKNIPVLFAGAEAMASTVPYVIKNVDGVRVGIISFHGMKTTYNGVEVAQRKALYAAYMSARKASDVLIVLDQANLATKEWLERNAKRLGSPDVIVGGVAQTVIGPGQTFGNTHVVPTGVQAKAVGVVDVEFTPGSAPKCNVQLVQLNEQVPMDEAIAARVSTLMGSMNQPAGPVGRPMVQPAPVEPGKPYYASETCKGCHMKHYEDWASSDHSQAVTKLALQNRAIPECLACHSERYRRTMDAAVASSDAKGVECATCHIQSLPHGLERRNVTAKAKVDPKLCVQCHTPEWSPDYDEKTYMPKVAHSGSTIKTTAANATK